MNRIVSTASVLTFVCAALVTLIVGLNACQTEEDSAPTETAVIQGDPILIVAPTPAQQVFVQPAQPAMAPEERVHRLVIDEVEVISGRLEEAHGRLTTVLDHLCQAPGNVDRPECVTRTSTVPDADTADAIQ